MQTGSAALAGIVGAATLYRNGRMAGTTGLEPAASAVTGQRSNQLNYVPTLKTNDFDESRF